MEPPTVEEHKDGQVVDGVLIKTIFPRNLATNYEAFLSYAYF